MKMVADYARTKNRPVFRIAEDNFNEYKQEQTSEIEPPRPPAQSVLCEDDGPRSLNTNTDRAELLARERQRRAADAVRLEQQQLADEEEAEVARLAEEQENIRKAAEQAEAARRREQERRRRREEAIRLREEERLKETDVSDAACAKQIEASIAHLSERIRKCELDENGPNFHPVQTNILEAHANSANEALFNMNDCSDSSEVVLLLGIGCVNVLKVLTTKRIIIGHVRDELIEDAKNNSPDIKEDGFCKHSTVRTTNRRKRSRFSTQPRLR